MIGQTSFIKFINNLELNNFPRSILLLGNKGCGKKSLIDNIIVPKLGYDIKDLTDRIDQETIEKMYIDPIPCIYRFDLRQLTIKEQNMLLKIVEEPPKGSYLIFMEINKSNVIPTLLNRCQIWEFLPYSKTELEIFLENEAQRFILDFCSTPGEVIEYRNISFQTYTEIKSICEKMVSAIATANFANILTISDRIDFKGNDDSKWNIDFFCKILLKVVTDTVLSTPSSCFSLLYIRTNLLNQALRISNINKQHLFENYLFDIKKIMKKG